MSNVMSMTGFASVTGALEGGSGGVRGFTLTMKGVNHRHLDLSVRLPLGMDALEPGLRRAVKSAVRRGHVELTLMLEKVAATAAVELEEGLLEAYVAAFRRAADKYELAQDPDLNGLLRVPGVMSAAVVQATASEVEGPVLEAMRELLARFNEARAAEGAALAAELKGGMATLARLTEEARGLREGAQEAELARLRARVTELLAGVAEVSEERVAAEAALLVARGDVEEELVRLRTHLDRFVELLDAGGEVGRSLDFLLQEINREANTLLSKTGGSGSGLRLTDVGLEMKVGLERAREQVQNLE